MSQAQAKRFIQGRLRVAQTLFWNASKGNAFKFCEINRGSSTSPKREILVLKPSKLFCCLFLYRFWKIVYFNQVI